MPWPVSMLAEANSVFPWAVGLVWMLTCWWRWWLKLEWLQVPGLDPRGPQRQQVKRRHDWFNTGQNWDCVQQDGAELLVQWRHLCLLYVCVYTGALSRFILYFTSFQSLGSFVFSVRKSQGVTLLIKHPEEKNESKKERKKERKKDLLHPKTPASSFAIPICFEAAKACLLVCLSEAVNT